MFSKKYTMTIKLEIKSPDPIEPLDTNSVLLTLREGAETPWQHARRIKETLQEEYPDKRWYVYVYQRVDPVFNPAV